MCFLFLLVFHEFESPGIELATVKVVILFLNFADIRVLFYLFGHFFVLTNLTSEVKEQKSNFSIIIIKKQKQIGESFIRPTY